MKKRDRVEFFAGIFLLVPHQEHMTWNFAKNS